MTSYLNQNDIQAIGFKHIGKNTQISRHATFYGPARIEIGDNVRIDDFCVLSAGDGGISIGNFITITIGVTMQGTGRITLKDFTGIAPKVSIFSTSDDYSGNGISNAAVPIKYRRPITGDVMIGRGVVIGSNSVILPGVTLNDYCSVGAMSLVVKDCESFWVYFGSPARKLKERSKNILTLENQFINENL